MSEKKTVAEKGALSRRRFIVTAAAGASASGASVLTSCMGAATKVEATAAQRVHPLLIRNDHNSLMHVVVEVGQQDVRATSFTFFLGRRRRSGGHRDFAPVYSGDKRPPELDKTRNGRSVSGDRKALLAELTATPFGREAKPAAELTFRGDQALRPGTNVFWLSCKLSPTADLSHKVGARCMAIETSAGMVAPREATPGARKRIGVALRRHYDDGVDT